MHRLRAAPSGLAGFGGTYPGLTPWAKSYFALRADKRQRVRYGTAKALPFVFEERQSTFAFTEGPFKNKWPACYPDWSSSTRSSEPLGR